jgi:hypothetical protein
MIAADVQNFALDKLPVNWFDALVLGLLVAGLFRGRKNGMSKEILPLLKWLTLVLVSGFFYPMAAQLLVNSAGCGKSASYILGYLLLAFVIIIVFMIFKRLLGSRTSENNFFGSSEYYLGMVAGMVRFACALLAVLALLNAPYYSPADIQARQDYNNRWYGGGVKGYSGNYIPDLPTVQESVFKKSFTGPFIKDYLGQLLVETAPPSGGKPEQTAAPGAAKPEKKTPVITIGK